MALKDILDRAARAGAATAKDLTEESRRRERRAHFTEQARRELRDEAQRVRSAHSEPSSERPGAGPGSRPAGASGSSGSTSQRTETRTFRFRGKVVADYYETLEVSPRARQAVIEKAYRALMREDHPDVGGDPRKAQTINEAYEVLRDPATRGVYDHENGLS